MYRIERDGWRLVGIGSEGREDVLIDTSNFFRNISKARMHHIGQEGQVIMDLLEFFQKRNDQITQWFNQW